MGFSDLKKNKASAFSNLQKKLEETNKVGTVDERIWKIQTDKAGNGFAVIRFLPPSDGEDMPYCKLYSHAFQGPGGWYIENSLTTIGAQDPLGNYNRELWNSGDESLKEQVRKQKRKLSYYSNIYVVKDPANPDNEGKVFLFRYGKKIHDKIMDVVNGDELEGRDGINPFDFWAGADFKLRAKKVAGYPNYDSSEFKEPGTLEDLDDAQLESIWKRQYSLNELVAPEKFKSFEQLQKRLNDVLNLKGGQQVESITSEESRKQRAEADPTVRMNLNPQPTKDIVEGCSAEDAGEADTDADDVMNYFQKLANEG